MTITEKDYIWAPSSDRVQTSNVFHFMTFLQSKGVPVRTYLDLRKWSVDNSEQFWVEVWDYSDVIGNRGDGVVVDKNRVERAQWFPNGQLNFAENLLRHQSEKAAIIEIDADGKRNIVSFDELGRQVRSVAQFLKELGIKPGDVVAGIMDNSIPTVIACLAAAQVGAAWTSCSVEFGQDAIVERLGQVSPKVLFALSEDFGKKPALATRKLEKICGAIPSVVEVIICKGPAIELRTSTVSRVSEFDVVCRGPEYTCFEKFPFNQLLYILYSSGTTGVPKCIMHGAGGTLLQHIKELGLHVGLKERDTILYYTSCGWMMWNWLISSLFFGATVVLFGGSPIMPTPQRLFDLCISEAISVLGVSPRYLEACLKFGVKYDLEIGIPALRTILSTGSVLQPYLYDYVYKNIKKDVLLSSISGGSDIVSCFCLGSEMLPVHRGESQTIGLGMDVAAYADDGTPLISEKGELVCRNAFPSRPLGFWGDPTGDKFHNAYFKHFPNVWTHGDFIEITERNGVVFHGRSDATLNVGGVRVGTAEIYRQISKLPAITDAVAVEQSWRDDSRMLLFLKMTEGHDLDRKMQREIRKLIRENLSEDHVPNKIIAVPDLPRTYSGKTVELAINAIVNDREVKNIDAIENPLSLQHISDLQDIHSP